MKVEELLNEDLVQDYLDDLEVFRQEKRWPDLFRLLTEMKGKGAPLQEEAETYQQVVLSGNTFLDYVHAN